MLRREGGQRLGEVGAVLGRVLDDPSSWKASIEATADAHASGWPEYVSPPARKRSRSWSAIGSLTIIAPSGT